ncbi:MAG: hypothetical protein ABL864_02915 [Terricaulis sp.]
MDERSILAGPNKFEPIRNASACAPLTEISPAAPGDGAATLGFAFAWAQAASQSGLVLWAASEADHAEGGAPHAEGLAQLGLTLNRVLMVRTRTQAEALWATEQALRVPQAIALCTISPAKKTLSLTTTRRLLLAAEKHNTRCILLRRDAAGASAAWTRWRISAAPSQGAAHELGPPAFLAHLDRNRAGPTGLSWTLHWHSHEHVFRSSENTLASAVAAAFSDRSAAPRQRRAI